MTSADVWPIDVWNHKNVNSYTKARQENGPQCEWRGRASKCLFDVEEPARAGICSELGLDGKGVLDGREDPSGVHRQSPDF